MSKHNNLVKKLILSINNLIERNLNKLNFKKSKKNQVKLVSNNKVFFIFMILIVFCISYLFIPILYNKSKLVAKFENQLLKNSGINFILSKNPKYMISPTPHFVFNDSLIQNKKDRLADIKKIRVFISIRSLFSFKKLKIKDVVIEDINLNLNKENFIFIKKILINEISNIKIETKKGNIFYKNFDNEVLFINKILNSKIFYDNEKQIKVFKANNEIFNIPYSVNLENNNKIKKIFLNLNSKAIRLKIQNELNYSDELKIGLLNLIYRNSKTSINYELNKDFLKFSSLKKNTNQEDFLSGLINFKPFYLSLFSKLDKLNLSNLIDEDSLLLEIFKAEILNNENLTMDLDISSVELHSNDSWNDLRLKIKIAEGLINLNNSEIKWKDFVNFKLLNSSLNIYNNELVLSGRLFLNIEKLDKFYNFFQTPKKFRSSIKQIELDFTYNFDRKLERFDNIKVNKKISVNVSKFLDQLNSKKSSLKNKIYLKNFVNQILKVYAG